MLAPESISAIKDIVLAVSAAVTAVVALCGLSTWSRQLRGTMSFETARSLAKATYKLRDEIQICRSPLILSSEYPADYDRAVNDPSTKADAYWHVFSKRWQPVYTALQDFELQALEAEALWGESMRSKTDELRLHVNTLYAAIEAYCDNIYDENQVFDSSPEFKKKICSEVFASRRAKDNVLSNAIQSAVHAIEKELKPHLHCSEK